MHRCGRIWTCPRVAMKRRRVVAYFVVRGDSRHDCECFTLGERAETRSPSWHFVGHCAQVLAPHSGHPTVPPHG